jgi:hypothetical protein
MKISGGMLYAAVPDIDRARYRPGEELAPERAGA